MVGYDNKQLVKPWQEAGVKELRVKSNPSGQGYPTPQLLVHPILTYSSAAQNLQTQSGLEDCRGLLVFQEQ